MPPPAGWPRLLPLTTCAACSSHIHFRKVRSTGASDEFHLRSTIRADVWSAPGQAAASYSITDGLPLSWDLEGVFSTFPRLHERREQFARTLSGGEQQMLAIDRALMAKPRILLMDEPSERLAPQIMAEVTATIRRLKEQGLSIVLVEQNVSREFGRSRDGGFRQELTAELLHCIMNEWARIIEKRCARAAQANKREQVEGITDRNA